MRNRSIRTLLSCIVLTLAAASFGFAHADAAKPVVQIKTNMGAIVVELDRVKAPITVDNFLQYVHDGYYNGTIFHRVIKKFMIQGGGFTRDFQRKKTRPPIKNEANNGLSNLRGTIAMARTGNPHSATAQFFINVVDNNYLDFRSPTPMGWGYTVFGKVIRGMDVVGNIQNLATGASGPFGRDVPKQAVVIEEISLLGDS